MSAESVKVIERFYEALNQRRIDDAVECLHPEIEVHPAYELVDLGSVWRAHDGLREFMRSIYETWDEVTVQLKGFTEGEGDRILCHECWHVGGRGGIAVDTDLIDVYSFKDRLIVRIDGFREEAEALEAVGPQA